MSLLEKLRNINQVVYRCWLQEERFKPLCRFLSQNLQAYVYLADQAGRVEDYYLLEGINDCCWRGEKERVLSRFWRKKIARLPETMVEVSNLCLFEEKIICRPLKNYLALIPVNCAGKRLGSLIISKESRRSFTEEDLVLVECAAALIGMEISRNKSIKRDFSRSALKMACSKLSHSEKEALKNILEELEGNKGLVIARRIAEKTGICRGAITNVLKKMTSARVLQSRSLGAGGTHVQIIDERIFQEFSQ